MRLLHCGSKQTGLPHILFVTLLSHPNKTKQQVKYNNNNNTEFDIWGFKGKRIYLVLWKSEFSHIPLLNQGLGGEGYIHWHNTWFQAEPKQNHLTQ